MGAGLHSVEVIAPVGVGHRELIPISRTRRDVRVIVAKTMRVGSVDTAEQTERFFLNSAIYLHVVNLQVRLQLRFQYDATIARLRPEVTDGNRHGCDCDSLRVVTLLAFPRHDRVTSGVGIKRRVRLITFLRRDRNSLVSDQRRDSRGVQVLHVDVS